MKPPSKAASAHDGCHLFKLAAETRNQIYELVFTIETNEDDSISLNEDTMVPSNALTGTCQQIYNESREMWRAAYHDYPTKRTFSIDVTDRKRPYIPELGREFFVRMSSFCVIWRADEYNDGNPLLLTTSFSRLFDSGSDRGDWETHVDIHDKTWRPQDPTWSSASSLSPQTSLHSQLKLHFTSLDKSSLTASLPVPPPFPSRRPPSFFLDASRSNPYTSSNTIPHRHSRFSLLQSRALQVLSKPVTRHSWHLLPPHSDNGTLLHRTAFARRLERSRHGAPIKRSQLPGRLLALQAFC